MSKGMGVPVMLAVLALAGVAAFVVRAMVLRRATAAAAVAPAPETTDTDVDELAGTDFAGVDFDDISPEALTEVRTPAPASPAVGFPVARPEQEETELMGTARR
jgi:hypothetical protein